MNLVEATHRHAVQRRELLCRLVESPSAAIRWRFMDYEQLLTKQLKLLAGPEFSANAVPRLNGWEQE